MCSADRRRTRSRRTSPRWVSDSAIQQPFPTEVTTEANGRRPSMAEPAIAVQALVKTFGARRAVDGISFEVKRGEIFALLGPNGAGKTTTVETLEGYRRPDAGSVRVLGTDPWSGRHALVPRIGVMPQEGGVYPGIRVGEAVRLFASYYDGALDADALLE